VTRIYAEATDVKEQVDKDKTTKGASFVPLEQREIIAMIAYLQRLGTDIKTTQIQTASVN
jgi:cytochrome c oxidase cbb3-type subunit I/II